MLLGNLKITIETGKVIIETNGPASFTHANIKNNVVQELMRAAADAKELEDIDKRRSTLLRSNNNGESKKI